MKLGIKSLMIVIIIFTVIGIVVIGFHHTPTQLPKPVLIDIRNQPTIGNSNANIHFVIFEDLKCYNCMRYNMQLYPKIEKNYIQTGKATYTIVNVAFLPNSIPAANAARCVYTQNKKRFFEYIKNVYSNQPPEEENWATIPNLMNFAKNLSGINMQKLSQCMYASPYTYFINNNLKMGSNIMNGAVETPTLYINGYIVRPLTMSRINQIIKAIE